MSLLKHPFFLVGVSITLGVTGQFLFKKGLQAQGGEIEVSLKIVRLLFTPYIFAGLCAYGLSTFTYLSALSKAPLSIIYPMISMSYILVFIISVLFLNEKYTHLKLLANLFIIAGVVLLNVGRQ